MRWRRNAAADYLLVACVLLPAVAWLFEQRDVSGQDAGSINVAGIAIDYGDGQVTYAIVPFAEDSLSGIELLERSGVALLAVEFGGLGSAVCAIEETGCDLGACRARLCQTGDPDSPFWQYLQRIGDGAWQTAPLGPSSSTVEDGDVDGWFWTARAPDGEAVTLASIAERLDIDLDVLRSNPPETLAPTLVTFGASSDTDGLPGRSELLVGLLVLGAAIAVGAIGVVRSRRMARG